MNLLDGSSGYGSNLPHTGSSIPAWLVLVGAVVFVIAGACYALAARQR